MTLEVRLEFHGSPNRDVYMDNVTHSFPGGLTLTHKQTLFFLSAPFFYLDCLIKSGILDQAHK